MNIRSLSDKLAKWYFDVVYVPIYDATTGQLKCYQQLQQNCIDKLELADGDNVLCVGVGTGNEIMQLMAHPHLNLTGVDYSAPSIDKARDKIEHYADKVSLLVMDAQYLEFNNESFDKILCVCVMSFVSDKHKATNEIVRVLKSGGRFVVTYPVKREGTGSVVFHQLRYGAKISANRFVGLLKIVVVSILYVPLMFLPRDKPESLPDLIDYLDSLGIYNIKTEVDPVYGLIIVSGDKK